MHHPGRPEEAEAAARIVALPVTPIRVRLSRSGLMCRLVGDPAVLRAKVAEHHVVARAEAGVVLCPECGTGNRQHRDWCRDCGEPLSPAVLERTGRS